VSSEEHFPRLFDIRYVISGVVIVVNTKVMFLGKLINLHKSLVSFSIMMSTMFSVLSMFSVSSMFSVLSVFSLIFTMLAIMFFFSVVFVKLNFWCKKICDLIKESHLYKFFFFFWIFLFTVFYEYEKIREFYNRLIDHACFSF